MRTMTAKEARANWSKILEEVSKGESITITKQGEPIAELRPPQLRPLSDRQRPDPKDAVEALRAFRKREKMTLDGLSIREMREEGRM
ncbi:MAG TPA: type II toxin-antitoxin system prevent-host-death family antitoxin [Thermomicrobiales bacterium]|jgi:prevent-host-death family protein